MNKIYIVNVAMFFLMLFSCESPADEIARRSAAAQNSSQPAGALDGMAIFRQNCVICHGTDGKLGLNGAKDISASVRPVEERVQIITHGKNLMTPFEKVLSPAEITAVADYTFSLKK